MGVQFTSSLKIIDLKTPNTYSNHPDMNSYIFNKQIMYSVAWLS